MPATDSSVPATTKTPLTSWFFWRAYGAVVLGIIAIALLLDALLGALIRSDNESTLINAYSPLLVVLGTELAQLAPEARTQRLQTLTANSTLHVELVPTEQFAGTPDLMEQLQAGTPQLYYNNSASPFLYQQLPQGSAVLVLGPLPDDHRSSVIELGIICLYYMLIAGVLLLWIWPFYRDLSLLREAAVEFGKADFTTRVALGNNSSILPVAQAFNTMTERIESLVSSHKELTHAVSHELRTPLARSKFCLEMLSRNPEPQKMQSYLDSIKTDVAELETLIDEMLSYARLSTQNLSLTLADINLPVWLQQELGCYANEAIKLSWIVASPPATECRVHCNPELMARAIHNIIRNGLRYAQTRIDVKAELQRDHCVIMICDDGPGIPKAMRTQVFEPFSRLETSRDKASGGYGLGLAIAARILQRHQGSISVEDCKPHGACFTLEWPCAAFPQ